ncbi:hypothetical protein DFQ27_003284 [Actinomortierella ambigua]|uniref:Uncharacterized protein n=1 Tax=Actinomortierella ambigua TaxID=1343610 RepID=A0A9P6Q8K9_9FUNG|nr:hypothetical protein DFQ27_003284 [Actinomortierella ambigua]
MLLSKSLVLLCSAVVVMARQSTRALASGAIFVGKDTTNPRATPLEIFENPENHAAAAASVVVFAAQSARFTPSESPAKSLVESFPAFLQKVASFPGFLTERNEQKTLELTGSLMQLEERVSEAVIENGAQVGRGIRDLVPSSIPDETLDKWILTLLVINKPDESDYVKIQQVYITLAINTDDHSPVIPQQSAKINISTYRVIERVFTSNAEKFAQRLPIYLVGAAIDFLTSPALNPEDEIFAPSCHGMF